MSSIAGQVGGSKTTLWAYFPSKEDLFAAVVDDVVEQYGEALSVDLPDELDLSMALRRYAVALISTLFSEPVLDLYRLVVGEAKRFPHLAALFYERGPRRGKARLAAYLEAAMARGEVRAGDPLTCAHQFISLCQAERYQHVILNLSDLPDRHQITADAEAAVDTFLHAWARRDD